MTGYLKRTWATVDLDNIAANFAQVRRQVGSGCKVLAVVKADAYGHGQRHVSALLAESGADWFGVSNIEEGRALRRWGHDRPVLIFGYTPPELAGVLAAENLTQAVYSLEYARALQEQAQLDGALVDIHIKVDTGMSRLGFAAGEDGCVGAIAAACGLPNLRPKGIFTHLACADEVAADSVAYTKGQFKLYQEVLAALEERGLTFELRHVCNSAGLICYPEMHLDMVRPGIVLYGLLPSADCAGKMPLRSAMSIYSAVSMVKDVKAGTAFSYGRTYIAPRDMRVATVAVGYADGYGRELSNRFHVLIGGEYAPIVGRVCMDQMIVDVSAIPGVEAGDTVTLIGGDGEKRVTLEEMADQSGTICYEKACLVGRRVPRIYLRHGREEGVADYASGGNNL